MAPAFMARKIVDILAEHPVVSSDLIAARLEVSERSGRIALRTLADGGIVQPYERQPTHAGRPRRFWLAGELIELVSGWPGTWARLFHRSAARPNAIEVPAALTTENFEEVLRARREKAPVFGD